MVLVITAALVGFNTQPRPVQVNVTGLTIGEAFTVIATSGTWSRPVQGGQGVADSTQLLLIDVATPLNAPVTYTVTHAGATALTAASVVVAFEGEAVLQSLDGRTIAGFDWMDNGDPKAQEPRVALYRPSGRSRPVVHYDVAGDESGTIVAETSGLDTSALRELIRRGAPVLVRAEPGLRDLEPVEILAITGAPRELVGAVGGLRQWTLAYTLAADNDDTQLVMATFEHFNTVWAGQTFAAFNTVWAGQTFAAFNAFDWVGEAS